MNGQIISSMKQMKTGHSDLKNVSKKPNVKSKSLSGKQIKMYALWSALFLPILCCSFGSSSIAATQKEDFLSWDLNRCKEMIKLNWGKGKVKAGQGLIHTERARDYKLRATWLTPEVIRASARILQLGNRLTDDATRALVAEAEAIGDTIVIVDIDPREGSGVIPNDWQAFLQAKSGNTVQVNAAVGVSANKLRDIKVVASAVARDYDYDRFYVIFPLKDENGEPIFSEATKEAELVVRIYHKEGKVSWTMPDSIYKRMQMLKKDDE
jgi:hypothetical protein